MTALETIIENHKRLIKIMEALPIEHHDQAHWAYFEGEHPDLACGTSACALGWAALSGEIPRLSAYPNESNKFMPLVDGRMIMWETAGALLFGVRTLNEVFLNLSLTKDQVIEKLKFRLASLEAGGDLT